MNRARPGGMITVHFRVESADGAIVSMGPIYEIVGIGIDWETWIRGYATQVLARVGGARCIADGVHFDTGSFRRVVESKP